MTEAKGMTPYEQKVLLAIGSFGGYTTGQVAREVGPLFGHNARTHSGFIRQVLLSLEKKGFIEKMDQDKPVCWQRKA